MLLIPLRAHANMAKETGVTPTFIAAQGGHSEALKLLIALRADVSLTWTRVATRSELAQLGLDVSGNSHWVCSARWQEPAWKSASPVPVRQSVRASAAISACEKGQEWQLALGLLSATGRVIYTEKCVISVCQNY